jgi:FkbM family methyltransferase
LDDISKDDVVLDAGANIGIFSPLAAQKGAKVVSVEPDHTNYNHLLRNIKLNNANNITPAKAALLDYEGRAHMSGKVAQKAISQKGSQVKVAPIDRLLEKLSLKNVNLVKMNIEGSESKALKGAYLTNVRELIIEVHEKSNYDICSRILTSTGLVVEKWRLSSLTILRGILKNSVDFLNAELKTKFMASKLALKYLPKMAPHPVTVPNKQFETRLLHATRI